MTLTRNAIGNLVKRYEAVLKKCRLCNVFGSLAAAAARMTAGAGKALASGTLLACLVLLPATGEATNNPADGVHGNMFYPNTSSGNTDVNFDDQTGNYSTVESVYGGRSTDNDASNNKITIGGSVEVTNVNGGFSYNHSAANNTVIVNTNGGSILNVSGGESASGDATDNEVTVNNGDITIIYGGYAAKATVSNNKVTINGGTVNIVNGGVGKNSTGNTVIINGDSVITEIYGGNAVGGTATNNTVVLGSDFSGDISQAKIFGGKGGSDTVTGNTLQVLSNSAQAKSIQNFATYDVQTNGFSVEKMIVSGGEATLKGGGTLSAQTITLDSLLTVKGSTLSVTTGDLNLSQSSIKIVNDGTVKTTAGAITVSDALDSTYNGTIQGANGVTLEDAVSSPDLNIIADAGDITATAAGVANAKSLTATNGDIVATGQNITAGTISASGDITAGTISASGDITAGSVKANSLSAANLTLTGTGSDIGTANLGTGTLAVNANAGGNFGDITAGTVSVSGIVTANTIAGDLVINGGQVAANTVTDNDISFASGGLTLGSTDAAPLQQAMAKAGTSAGLSVARPTDISNSTGSIKVGADAADPGAGGVSFGSNTVLDVNAGSVADADTPVLTAKEIKIGGNAVLSVSGITTARSFKAFEATEGSSGSFAAVVTDSTLYGGVINPDGTVTLREESANSSMPELDPGLAGLLNGAARNGEIGTDGAHIFSNQGGTRFLSRIISRDYGGADPEQAARTLESAARGAVAGAVPQMAMAAANAGAGAVAGRMLPPASGGGVLTVSLDGGTVTGLAAGDEPAGRRTGLAVWIMPLYQNWSGFGLEGGSYEMDVRGALGGLALGADYTFANAIRAGITFNMGGGYAEGSGDFNTTTNNMTFWGAGLYAGWLPGDFALTADVNFTSVQNRLTQELPAAMQMSDMEADISSWALSAGLRADYTFRTDWLNVTPHAGVRFTHLKVNGYELESGGLTVLEGDDIYQSIWSFPIGVTFARNFGTDSGGR